MSQETSYTFDTLSGKIIVGIPTPKKNHFRGFGYRLTESLLSTTMKVRTSGMEIFRMLIKCFRLSPIANVSEMNNRLVSLDIVLTKKRS